MSIVRLPTADPLDALTPREREILASIAAGYANAGICRLLHLSEKTVEAHVRTILRKLDLPPTPYLHRRVLAVRIYLEASARHPVAA